MPIPSRVPGLIVNPEYGLFLRFQFNPQTLSINKSNNYTTIPVNGWTEPVLVWGGGQIKKVSFELNFRADHGSQVLNAVGVRDFQAILESFLYPGVKISSVSIKNVKKFLGSSVEQFIPPPDATFIFGPNFWRGKLIVDSINLGIFDPQLTPRSLDARVTLQVISSGIFAAKEEAVRRTLATVVYPLNRLGGAVSDIRQTVSTISNTVENLVV